MAEDIIFQSAVDTLQRGDKAAAKTLFARLIKINPKNVKYWLWISAAVETREEQVYCLQTAHKLDPENAIAKRGLTDLDAPLGAQTVRTLHTTQQVSANIIFKNAVKAVQNGNKSIAKDLLTHLLKTDGNNVTYWLWMSAAVESSNEQIFCLQTALKLDPDNAAAKRGLNQLDILPIKETVRPVQQISSHVWKEDPLLPSVTLKTTEEKAFSPRKHSLRKTNWALILGSLLVAFMILLAVFGPHMAPQDPMKENYTLEVNGNFHTPPYGVNEIPGYPLGTDRYGRDLLSRILWAVRPTMIMVVTVAGVRLLLGLVLGMIIGWSEGRKGRFLDSFLSTALSIPILIAALVGIFTIGIDHGLWAFIFGLGITGWAETARMVSEQTRVIKTQTFVEAARALGASDRRILYVHVLRQIISLVWMLLAFEISSTLLVSAELGFLGYYIGGGIWVEITDFNAVNVEGLPELGQMISSSLIELTNPSTLIIVGSVICIGVLGFNLLGEGLRLRLSRDWMRGRRRFRFLSEATEEWLEERVLHPILFWMESHRMLLWVSAFSLVIISGAWLTFKSFYIKPLASSEIAFETPGEQLWASDRHDPYGTLWVPASLDSEPIQLWNVPLPGGNVGSPAINANGMVFINAHDKLLLAINPDGSTLWQAQLDEIPVGAPALDSNGRIFVSDVKGYVTAFDMDGNRIWRVRASTGRGATSGPLVDAKGNIYLTIIDTVSALSPQGELLWRTSAADLYLEEPPRLSPDQSLIFLKNTVMQTDTGTIKDVSIGSLEEILFTDPTYFSGANGLNYYRLGHDIIGWHLEDSEVIIDSRLAWAHDGTVLLLPFDQGVTKNGLTWLFYKMQFTDARMVWLDAESRVVGNYAVSNINPKLIAVGEKDEAYICDALIERVDCINIAPGANAPSWTISIDLPTSLLGGALVPGRFYLSLNDGLFAFEVQEK